MSFFRNNIDLDGGGFNAVGLSGQRPNNPRPKVEAHNKWHPNVTEGRDIELRSKPVPNQPEMLVFVPREPLPEGHYTVFVNKKAAGPFRVGPELDDTVLAASADCIDLESWATLSGRREQMLPCSGSGAGAPGRKDAAGVAGSAAAPASSAATSDLTALLQKSPTQPQQPDKRHEEDSIGVVLEYPADYELTTSKQPVIATLLAPGRESTDPTATKITVTMSRDIPRLIPLSLDASVQSTLNGTRAAMAESTVVGPVPTTMNNVDAQIFLVTGKEEGVLKKKAVTVAVADRKVMGVVLHATPETFDAAWDGYRRVVASYTKK